MEPPNFEYVPFELIDEKEEISPDDYLFIVDLTNRKPFRVKFSSLIGGSTNTEYLVDGGSFI
jgi:hypothetical protein